MRRVCLITSAPQSLYHFHKGWMQYFHSKGYEITGIAGPGAEYHQKLRQEFGMRTFVAPLKREIHLLKDCWCLLWLWWFLLWHRYDIVHVGTPKASLLGALAARLSFHLRIVMTHHGRVYENATGKRRKLFSGLEKITATCISYCIPVAKELRDNLVKEGLYPQKKLRFLSKGTCNGLDTEYFSRSDEVTSQGRAFRDKLGVPDSAIIILFIGRIRRDKGIEELVEAFDRVAAEDHHLAIVGPSETNVMSISPETRRMLEQNSHIHELGPMSDVRPAYAAADIFVLPSHREGFPLVPMEAAAMGLPVIASDISGCREAVADGVTGLLFPKEDVNALVNAMRTLLENPEKRRQLGHAGRERVIRDFQPEAIWNGIITLYNELLE